MKKVYDWFGGRRYFFAEQVFIFATILLLTKSLSENNWVEVTIWTLGIYAGANVLQKIFEAKKNKE